MAEFTPVQATVVAATRLTKFHVNGLVSVACVVPYYVWVEILTHKRFARNAMSHRAAGVKRFAHLGFWKPEKFLAQGKGMTSGEPLDDEAQAKLFEIWEQAADESLQHAQEMASIQDGRGRTVAREFYNRLLDPHHMVKGLMTGTEDAWGKWLLLRDHPAADNAMQVFAEKVKWELAGVDWDFGDRHTPYMTPDDRTMPEREYYAVCGARIARVSFGNNEPRADDLDLARRLVQDGHLSPFEHIARVGMVDRSNMRSAIYSKDEDACRGHYWVNLRSQLEQGYML